MTFESGTRLTLGSLFAIRSQRPTVIESASTPSCPTPDLPTTRATKSSMFIFTVADLGVDAGALLFELRRVTRIAEQHGMFGRDEQEAVVAGEAGQIGDVDEIRHQHAVDAGFGKAFAELVAACVESVHICSLGNLPSGLPVICYQMAGAVRKWRERLTLAASELRRPIEPLARLRFRTSKVR